MVVPVQPPMTSTQRHDISMPVASWRWLPRPLVVESARAPTTIHLDLDYFNGNLIFSLYEDFHVTGREAAECQVVISCYGEGRK